MRRLAAILILLAGAAQAQFAPVVTSNSTLYIARTNGPVAITNINGITAANVGAISTNVAWDDSPMVFSWQQAGAVAPTRTAFRGINILAYGDNDELDFMSQIRHTIAPSNTLLYTEPHAHVLAVDSLPPTANRTRLQIVYYGAAVNGTLYGPVSNVTEVALSSNTHHYVDFQHLDFTNFYPGFSGKFWGTLKRLAAASSNYAGNISLDGDFHFPVNRLGTPQEAGE